MTATRKMMSWVLLMLAIIALATVATVALQLSQLSPPTELRLREDFINERLASIPVRGHAKAWAYGSALYGSPSSASVEPVHWVAWSNSNGTLILDLNRKLTGPQIDAIHRIRTGPDPHLRWNVEWRYENESSVVTHIGTDNSWLTDQCRALRVCDEPRALYQAFIILSGSTNRGLGFLTNFVIDEYLYHDDEMEKPE